MPDEEERTCPICGFLRIAKVNQHGLSFRGNAYIIWFNISMDDRWLLAMQENNGIGNRKNPGQDLCYGDGFVALAHKAGVVCEITSFYVAKHHIVTSPFVECRK